MTDPYQQNPQGGPQYGPPGTGPNLNKPQDTTALPQSDPYAQQPSDPYAQQPANPYGQQYDPANPYGQPGGYPPAGYGQTPGYNPNDPEAPWGRDQFGVPFSDKQKLIAGLLQIFLGAFGVGRFYTGYNGIAIAQIAVTWLTCGFGAIWPIIDGVLMLVGKVPDSDGRPLRD
ncbi:TM2 domain-containing protein [Nocardia altamirensis]|uniref:TM2 domain-containing protein n=1 Tax=Nocardia altamirensis TaxID=472158 RepID=UPI00084018B7|nr:TM2 domain-containing protein [Nocardia altamirensis]